MSDPFTLCHDALWALAEAHAPLAARVKLGNRVHFTSTAETSTGARDPLKDTVQDADLPELRLIPGGMTPHLQRTSNSSTILKRFQWQLATGEQLADLQLFPVEWELYRAMADWATVLTALTWSGKPFVRLARPITVDEGVVQADLQRNIRGWSAIWQCEVLMVFSTADLADAS